MRGLPQRTDPDLLLRAAGRHDEVDLEIFATLSADDEAPDHLIGATSGGIVDAATAAGMLIGLLAKNGMTERQLARSGRFLHDEFYRLDADTRMAAVSVSSRLECPALLPIVDAGLNDSDPTVRSFAQEAARTLCIDGTDARGAVPNGQPSLL